VVAGAADLGVLALLFNQLGREDLERFVEVTIGPVIAYDADRGTELVDTLAGYFAAGGNVTRAAAALHVHVNTLYQRCDRIAELLSPTWQEPDQALRIQLALQVRRVQAAL
jgi:DNA-binding PucR family transcriptional regulator